MRRALSQLGDVNYSFRRHHVDTFLAAKLEPYRDQKLMGLELGGRRLNRRGRSDPTSYGFKLICADIVAQPGVDIVTDAQNTCFTDGTFDIVLCSEVLEHVYNPCAVLSEIYRILKPDGRALLTVPFFYQVHADPHDFGRYTETYWRRAVTEAGFDLSGSTIEVQGGYFSALAHMIVYGLRQRTAHGPDLRSRAAALMLRMLPPLLKRVPHWDERADRIGLRMFPSGYGIELRKSSTPKETTAVALACPKS